MLLAMSIFGVILVGLITYAFINENKSKTWFYHKVRFKYLFVRYIFLIFNESYNLISKAHLKWPKGHDLCPWIPHGLQSKELFSIITESSERG